MDIDYTVAALMFPAIPLMMTMYSNRFHTLSAGCIVNDLVDKDFDRKVKRTKERPIASKKISTSRSLFYVGVLCILNSPILAA